MLEKDIKKVLVSHDEIVEAAKKLGETWFQVIMVVQQAQVSLILSRISTKILLVEIFYL